MRESDLDCESGDGAALTFFLLMLASKLRCPFTNAGCWKKVPEESLTLWKPYMFSCLTNDVKLLCLKCFGSIPCANSFGLLTTKPVPSCVQEMMWKLLGS